MKEKDFVKWIGFRIVGITVIFILVLSGIRLILPNEMTVTFDDINRNLTVEEIKNISIEDFIITWEKPEYVYVKSVYSKDDKVYFNLKGTGKGKDTTALKITYKKKDLANTFTLINISKTGNFSDTETGNFPHFKVNIFIGIIYIFFILLILFLGYKKADKEFNYSYQAIFCIGLFLWIFVVWMLLISILLFGSNMNEIYGTITSAPSRFAICTFPLLFIFSILLSISNISLIKHEGKSLTNILGIILSFMIVFGFIALILIDGLVYHGSSLLINSWHIFMEFLYCVYTLLECFLLGSIICGKKKAKNNPDYDKDYIVILGCMVRSDGTLPPLLKGRVDRAIKFYNDQIKETGKVATFIPSGGKGVDEPIAEGDAMKNYLLSVGIPEERILVENRSNNTKENMLFSKVLMKENTKAAFATTNYHVFRSGILSKEVGVEIDGMGSSTKWYFWPNAYIREVVGMLSYKWKALISFLIPIVTFLAIIQFVYLK